MNKDSEIKGKPKSIFTSIGYVFRAMFILAPATFLMFLVGSPHVYFFVLVSIMIYAELLEISDKLKK